jgi:integrase
MNVPKDLQSCIGKKELRYTLRTGYIGQAKFKSRYLASQVQLLFRYLRRNHPIMSKLSKEQIPDLVKQYIRDRYEFLDGMFADERYLKEFDSFKYDGADIEGFLENTRDNMASLRYQMAHYCQLYLTSGNAELEMLADNIRELLQKNGVDPIVMDSPAYKALSVKIHDAEAQLFPLEADKLKGGHSYKLEMPKLFPEVFPSGTMQIGATKPQTSDTIKQAADDYWLEYSGDIKPRSKTDYRGILNHITEHFGSETQLHTIDYMMVKDFRDGLRSGKMSLRGNPLSVNRINNYLDILKKIYTLARRKDKSLDPTNPAEGLRLRDKSRPDEKRKVFTTKDLEILFVNSPEYGKDLHKEVYSFWIPLLGLYTGARLEEICQLLLNDVVQLEGIWCLNIDESDAPKIKSVKNSEKRVIPLHPFLTDDLGFVQYVKSIPQKKIRIFHEFKRTSNRWGHYYSKRFSKFKKDAGIVAPPGKKVFHSFRHTFIDNLKQNGANEQYVKEYVGHSGGGSDITWGLYGKQFKPQVLMDEVVLKLTYPIDLSHLKKSKFVVK